MQEYSDREAKIQKMLFGPQLGILLYSVVDLNIPRLLASGPKTAEELASESSSVPDKLERVLLALETEKLFAYNEQTRQFSNTSITECLLNEQFAKFVKLSLNPYRYEFYSVFPEVLKSEKTAPELKFNQTFNDFISQRPELLEEYIATYKMFIKIVANDIAPHIDLRNSRKVIEVGGRDGTLLNELAKVYRDFTGTIYEQTVFRNFVEKNISDYGHGERIKVASGNFVDAVPEGFDTVILKCAISEYNNQQLENILKNCRRAIEHGNKLFLTDHILDRHDQSTYKLVSQLDIYDLIVSEGRIRTRQELEQIFDRSGFRITNYQPVKRLFVVEATAV
ncbi:unnamed protein product [Blepharisma stoltei]|uniref:O-methyltransferase n=1 Tax=Blepharisma stoltei TaxID=1481888 RepID=A0AAU9KD93_9CILI|nr:unnamed protein product [Blepharisma stoltei]